MKPNERDLKEKIGTKSLLFTLIDIISIISFVSLKLFLIKCEYLNIKNSFGTTLKVQTSSFELSKSLELKVLKC